MPGPLIERNRRGRVEVDFGAFPGSGHTSHTIGVHGITTEDDVVAYLVPVATDDHSADEHCVEPIRVSAQPSTDMLTIHLTLEPHDVAPNQGSTTAPTTYGKWLVAWQF